MKSRPFTSLSALAKVFPTELSIDCTSIVETVAGASVIFSTRRDADVTTAANVVAAAANHDVDVRIDAGGHGDARDLGLLADANRSHFVRRRRDAEAIT